ncbi:hypothetical protein IB238_08545 [Rhizobium sp. ARZ01]|uniref:hypothetical protein n=1 Tax=Rhizobium sp. ARZ01 TaxID=2769313 RepID=UPI0017832680|nr:hypothetical protein [Rhizobium sp. ARZ01]MBD9372670.1 hypothetical protein [Rhizobium sp. ARZ01]
MESLAPADKIRAVINSVPVTAMLPDPDNARSSHSWGGRWFTPGKEAYLSLGITNPLQLRDAPACDPRSKPWIQWGRLRLGGVYVNFCISRWIEEVPREKGWFGLYSGAEEAALRLNLVIEQVNFSDAWYPAMAGLSDGEIEKVADFIRHPLRLYLKQWVANERNSPGQYSVPITGKLQENWRRPRPLLVEFHDHLAKFARDFSMERITDPILERYHIGKEDGDPVAYVDGEPDVLVVMPYPDREELWFCPGCVYIGNTIIRIGVESLASFRLPVPIVTETGSLIEYVSLEMITHPFSLRAEPRRLPPAGLDMATATRAVEHMRNARLRYLNASLRESECRFRPERADVVII